MLHIVHYTIFIVRGRRSRATRSYEYASLGHSVRKVSLTNTDVIEFISFFFYFCYHTRSVGKTSILIIVSSTFHNHLQKSYLIVKQL